MNFEKKFVISLMINMGTQVEVNTDEMKYGMSDECL